MRQRQIRGSPVVSAIVLGAPRQMAKSGGHVHAQNFGDTMLFERSGIGRLHQAP